MGAAASGAAAGPERRWLGSHRLWVVLEHGESCTVRSVPVNQHSLITRTEPPFYTFSGLCPQSPLRAQPDAPIACFLETLGNATAAPQIPSGRMPEPVVEHGAPPSGECLDQATADALHALLGCQHLVDSGRATPRDEIGRMLLRLSRLGPALLHMIMRANMQRGPYDVVFSNQGPTRHADDSPAPLVMDFSFELSGALLHPESLLFSEAITDRWTVDVSRWVDGGTIASLEIDMESRAQILTRWEDHQAQLAARSRRFIEGHKPVRQCSLQ